MVDIKYFEEVVGYILSRWPALVMAREQMTAGNETLERILELEQEIIALCTSGIDIIEIEDFIYDFMNMKLNIFVEDDSTLIMIFEFYQKCCNGTARQAMKDLRLKLEPIISNSNIKNTICEEESFSGDSLIEDEVENKTNDLNTVSKGYFYEEDSDGFTYKRKL